MKGGIDWKLFTSALDRDPWKLDLMFLSREIDIKLCQRNWVFATKSNFLIPLSLRPEGLIFQIFIIWFNIIHSLVKYLRSMTLYLFDIGIRESEFVEKTQILYTKIHIYAAELPPMRYPLSFFLYSPFKVLRVPQWIGDGPL